MYNSLINAEYIMKYREIEYNDGDRRELYDYPHPPPPTYTYRIHLASSVEW
jgi:hypothetical protein